ncbi:MAG: hypothetical protein ABIR30_10435 [Chitinophagaceae bacterium]
MEMDYNMVDQEVLIDMLAKHTAAYTSLYTQNGNPDELENLRTIMVKIQTAITARKRTNENTSTTGDNVSFTGDVA